MYTSRGQLSPWPLRDTAKPVIVEKFFEDLVRTIPCQPSRLENAGNGYAMYTVCILYAFCKRRPPRSSCQDSPSLQREDCGQSAAFKYIRSTYFPIGSMCAIYGNIYHQYTPVMLAYKPYMDPSWLLSNSQQIHMTSWSREFETLANHGFEISP